jgi:hypothetical protein
MNFADPEMKAILRRAVVHGKPRMFAMFGTLKHYPDQLLVGWGMELPAGGGALFQWLENRVIHTADSADRVAQLQAIVGDFEFVWVDE